MLHTFIERLDERRRKKEDVVFQQAPMLSSTSSLGMTGDPLSPPASAKSVDQLLAEAAENRDKASCCSGAKRRTLLTLAEMKEKRAMELRQRQRLNQPQHQNEHQLQTLNQYADSQPSVEGSCASSLREHPHDATQLQQNSSGLRSPACSMASYDSVPETSSQRQTLQHQLHQQQQDHQHDIGRAQSLLAQAAEKADKAKYVKGGKHRALLSISKRMEDEAHAILAAAAAQDEQIQQQHQLLHERRQQHTHQEQPPRERLFNDALDDDRRGLNVVQSEREHEQLHLFDDRQQHNMQHEQDYATKQITSNGRTPQPPTSAQQSASAEMLKKVESLRQAALLNRDQASCCSGAKRRQLLSLAAHKERKAAELIHLANGGGPWDAEGDEERMSTDETGSRSGSIHGFPNSTSANFRHDEVPPNSVSAVLPAAGLASASRRNISSAEFWGHN